MAMAVLEPKFALVTGSLGGIGQSICPTLRSAGYIVIGLDQRAKDVGDFEEDGYYTVQCDIQLFHTDRDSVRHVVDLVRSITKGQLHLLVNNAAYQVVKPAQDLSMEEWDKTLSTNVSAAFAIIQEFLPDLKSVRGNIINVSSIHANLTKPGFVAYATSKGALVSLTKALAVELGKYGVRVNAVLPAATRTPMLEDGFKDDPEGYNKLSQFHPVRRICEPVEIAKFIVYLSSEEAGFITGSALQIDGGVGATLHDPNPGH